MYKQNGFISISLLVGETSLSDKVREMSDKFSQSIFYLLKIRPIIQVN